MVKPSPFLPAMMLAAGALFSIHCSAQQPDLGIARPGTDFIPPETQAAIQELISSGRSGAQSLIDNGDMDWLEQARTQSELAENPLTGERPAPTAQQPPPHPLGDGVKNLIFVSWSMGESALRDILTRYHGHPATAVVFRGVPEGQPFAGAVMAVQRLSMDTQSDVTVLIDPIAYRTHGITAAPSVAIESPEGETVIKATGISSTQRLQEYLDEGREGDIGQLGPTVEIKERDLVEVAQQRIAELDFEKMKENATQNFWRRQSGHLLPVAAEDRVRRVDPSVTIHEPILDSKGNVVTPPGVINPLDIMPFDQKLIVIDPSLAWQVALAADVVANTAPEITVTVIATHIDPDEGWNMFTRTEEAIDAALYLLQPSLAHRFGIERVPSIVTAADRAFVVHEFSKTSVEEGRHVQ